jgi:hypothetical protein
MGIRERRLNPAISAFGCRSQRVGEKRIGALPFLLREIMIAIWMIDHERIRRAEKSIDRPRGGSHSIHALRPEIAIVQGGAQQDRPGGKHSEEFIEIEGCFTGAPFDR